MDNSGPAHTVLYNGYVFIANFMDRNGVRHENRIAFRKEGENFSPCDFEDMPFPITRLSSQKNGVSIELANGESMKLIGTTFNSLNPEYMIRSVCKECDCHKD